MVPPIDWNVVYQDAVTAFVLSLIVAIVLYYALKQLILTMVNHPTIKAIAGVARKFGGGDGMSWWEALIARAGGAFIERFEKGEGKGGPTVLHRTTFPDKAPIETEGREVPQPDPNTTPRKTQLHPIPPGSS